MMNTLAIFRKQLKDTLKNKTILIQFIMFPLMTLVMNRAVQMEDMPHNFFVNLFATMYIGMAPLTSMAAIISEEKEQNTLRVLLMSDVKPFEYLLGIGVYVWTGCMAGAAVICLAGGFCLAEGISFLCILSLGILASLLLGAAIGTFSNTQMMATSITVPVMMFFSFLPMISMFNATASKIAKLTYSGQIGLLLGQPGRPQADMKDIAVILLNVLLFTALFTAAYKKRGLN